MDTRDLLSRTAAHAADFLESLDERALEPAASVDELRADVERAIGAILRAVEETRPAVVRG